jgi:NAD(P)-dependent dehydrogenase (short-subunit alcohol dehydrogenase family)
MTADISNESDAARIIRAAVERFGRLDVLANIAGVRAPVGPVTEATPKQHRGVIG